MQKPYGWEDVPVSSGGDYERPTPGGYVMGVVFSEIRNEGEDNECLYLELDIAEGTLKNYYRKMGERLDKNCFIRKWFSLRNEKALPFFKGFISAIEDSNLGYKWNWQEKSLLKKFVGVNMREEEYEKKDGDIGTTLKPAFFCGASRVRNGEIQPLKPKLLGVETQAVNNDQSALPF